MIWASQTARLGSNWPKGSDCREAWATPESRSEAGLGPDTSKKERAAMGSCDF